MNECTQFLATQDSGNFQHAPALLYASLSIRQKDIPTYELFLLLFVK